MHDDDDTQGYGPGILIGAEEIGEHLRLPARKTRYLLQQGYIPAVKAGRRWFARTDELAGIFKTATVPVSTQAF
jgi:hypothetical protein